MISENSSLGSWKNCFHCKYLFQFYTVMCMSVIPSAVGLSDFYLTGCGASSGAELLGVEAEPWVFKGGLSGEVQVRMT